MTEPRVALFPKKLSCCAFLFFTFLFTFRNQSAGCAPGKRYELFTPISPPSRDHVNFHPIAGELFVSRVKITTSSMSVGLIARAGLRVPRASLLGSRFMSSHPSERTAAAVRPKVTVTELERKRAAGEKITVLTAYDYPSALLVERAGADVIGEGNGETLAERPFDQPEPAPARGAERAAALDRLRTGEA